MSQAPNLAPSDDPRDSATGDTTPTDKPATDPAWFFESTRDTHKFIREVNGRQFNAQNTTYFLPAGESSDLQAPLSSLSSQSSWMGQPSAYLSAESLVSGPIIDPLFMQIKSSMSACGYFEPCCIASVHDDISVASNTFVIAQFSEMSYTLVPKWSNSSYDLNPALRRRFST